MDAFYARIKRGATLRDALTKPCKGRKKARSPVDHMGNTYESLIAMCKAWEIEYSVFSNRMNKGWSLKDALETPKLS